MIKADIINLVAERSDLSRSKAGLAVETILDAMKEALGSGKRIELRGFGVFQVHERRLGVGRNPQTGGKLTIGTVKTVRFKPGKELNKLDCEPE